MKPTKPILVVAQRRPAKVPDKKAMIRAVASSTAIETGQSIGQIERTLQNKQSKFRHIALAD